MAVSPHLRHPSLNVSYLLNSYIQFLISSASTVFEAPARDNANGRIKEADRSGVPEEEGASGMRSRARPADTIPSPFFSALSQALPKPRPSCSCTPPKETSFTKLWVVVNHGPPRMASDFPQPRTQG